jgi:hypothetical protein
MSRITIDAALSEQLRGLAQPVELCDASGKVLGRYVPTPTVKDPRMEPQIDDAELERRKLQDGKGRTLSEIMADLEKRA